MDTVTFKVGPVTVDLLADDRICKHVLSGKTFEPDSLAAWADLCEAGSDVIDVGAYSGLFSIAAAKMGAVPLAFEPQPVMVERIRANSAINMVDFVTVNAAVSDTKGTARLGVNSAVHLTSGASLLRKSGDGIKVKTVCLDEINVFRLSAIKIDVERAELLVLRGAQKLIEQHRPKMLIEALDVNAMHAVEAALPNYKLAAYLDNRNMLMVPA